MLVLRYDDSGERLAKILAILQADRFDGGQRVEHFGGPDGQSCRAQHPDEMDDVVGDAAARRAALRR